MKRGDRLIGEAAQRMVQTGKVEIVADSRFGEITPDERKAIRKVAGMSVEAFNARMSQRLQELADKCADRIEQDLDSGAHKPGEMAFLYSVIEDKRARLDGRNAVQNAQINVQVNNFGDARTKQEMIDALLGKEDVI